MSIRKREGSPSYWYDFTVGGNRFRGSTETDDRATARAVETKLKSDAVLNKHLGRKPRLTLDKALGKFWLEHGQHCASAWDAMDGYTRNLLAFFGTEKHLDEIGDAEISSYKGEYIGKISNSTINRRLSFLRAVINKARKEWGVETGSLELGKHMMPEPEARTRWVTTEEADRLIMLAAPHLKAPIRFALLTGLRLANITGLRWEQVNLHERVIRLRVKSALPGRKLHEIPIVDDLFKLLVEQGPQKEGYVFVRRFKPDRKTGSQRRPEPIRKFRRSFQTACERAGIDDFRFHDLRHTAATWMLRAGVPLDMIQKVLGHEDIQTTMKYAHRAASEKTDALEALATAQIRHNTKKRKAV